jgi:50S ribosomal subunit-associated GTPase HflX|tara:strand:+ start:1570 stop:1803 length:234 start_codon:yes stop_codon:yes gene_type:complete
MAKKIAQEELTTLQALVKGINTLQMQVGGLESQKHEALHMIAIQKGKLDELQTALKEKHGDVQIDIQDGTISDAADS